jgi:hypothetical protein
MCPRYSRRSIQTSPRNENGTGKVTRARPEGSSVPQGRNYNGYLRLVKLELQTVRKIGTETPKGKGQLLLRDGSVYGATLSGGEGCPLQTNGTYAPQSCGTVFKITP